MTHLQAVQQITRILCELEKTENATVESLEVRDLDVTSYGHERKQISRRVVINLRPAPGMHWEVVA